MNTAKLEAALADLMEQKQGIVILFDDAIGALSALIKRLKASDLGESPERVGRRSEAPSYIDQAIEYINSTGKPAHIDHIVTFIRTTRNNEDIKRGSVESALARHIRNKGTAASLIKLGRAMYGLPHQAQRALSLNGATAPIN